MDVARLASRYEPKVAKALTDAWRMLQGRVPLGEIVDAMRLGPDAVVELLAGLRLTEAEMGRAVGPLVEAMRQAAKPAAAEFGLRFDLPDERAVRWVLQTVDERGWLRVGVDTDVREMIRETLRRAFIEGGHPYETARIIRGSIGLNGRQAAALRRFGEGLLESGISGDGWEKAMLRRETLMLRQRALTIARTETIRAARQGQLEGWREAAAEGLLQPERTWRRWVATSDPCPICVALNGTLVPLIGGEWPGVGSEVTAHPNCRCAEVLEFDVAPDDPRIVRG